MTKDTGNRRKQTSIMSEKVRGDEIQSTCDNGKIIQDQVHRALTK
jgi:hypothetical protein